MKTAFNFNVITLLLAATILFASCKKGDTGASGVAGANGANGAAGSAGTAGTAGANGDTGAQGPKGDTGTANVIYSAWINVKFSPITTDNGEVLDTTGFTADMSAAKLDTNILSQGEMKVYVNLGTASDPYVVPVPFNDVNSGVIITPSFLLQDINLSSNVDASSYNDSGSTYLQYRYILIPGGSKGRRMEPDWKNYNAVKAFYHLSD